MLQDFIAKHREAIIERARAKVAGRAAPRATTHELENGVPLFLTQLGNILGQEAARSSADGSAMATSASLHGRELQHEGFSVAQVVHDYGDLCQAITELALHLGVSINTEDFRTLNRCLDNAIASAVTGYAQQREVYASGAEVERQGFFAHELRNHLNTAMLAFHAIKSGRVGVDGSTIDVLERSLFRLRHLIDASVSTVRLESGKPRNERLRIVEFIDEMEIDAAIDSANRGLTFSVERPEADLFVDVDRHLLATAVSNLLQNAFKFTGHRSHVRLRVRSTTDHAFIEIEDECGGLQAEVTEAIFQPFERFGNDRSGLGLGLAISRQAVEAIGGRLTVRNKPGEGCVFTVEIPLAVDAPAGRVR